MKRIFIVICLALMLGASAQAKTPKEVLTEYKAYLTAVENKDKSLAVEKAYEAWQLAEKLMGDTKTTGDLAANFADLRPKVMNGKLAEKRIVKAYQRSIDLAVLQTEDARGIEIDRRTQYLSWLIVNVSKSDRRAWDKNYGPEQLNHRIREFGMTGSTFEAESFAFSAQIAVIDKKWDVVERDSKAAMKLFETRTDKIPSTYEFSVPTYLARAYANQDRPIDAALTYQSLMLKLEAQGGHKNTISGHAYTQWLELRDKVRQERGADPRAKQVTEFVVPAGRTAEMVPLFRIPPIMPTFILRGSKSGWVQLKYDISDEGKVISPVVLDSSSIRLEETAISSMSKWRYTSDIIDDRAKGLTTVIKFDTPAVF